MVGVESSWRWLTEVGRSAWRWHGHWMAWNTGLAVVPLVLSFALFRPKRRRSFLWWTGVALFVAFLPNAPYVLTDVVHLFGDIRRSDASDAKLLLVVVPVFALFFAIGMGCYAVSLRRLRAWIAAEAPRVRWWPAATALHLLCAIGLYLGRVVRLNSWDLFVAPGRVVDSAARLGQSSSLVLVGFAFVVLAATTALFDVVLDRLRARDRPGTEPLNPSNG
jgi:uncharacterized membrane protein